MARLAVFLFLSFSASGVFAGDELDLRALLSEIDITAVASALAPDGTDEYRDVEFANAGGVSLRLDLFVPDGSGPFPVVIGLHGGSWTSGTRDQNLSLLQVNRGYAVANIDYRLAPEWTYPAQIYDVKAAVRWLRANAATYRLNPNAIGVIGLSAGGHLAALLGTTAGVEELEGEALGNPGVSSRVQAVVDYFGPTDLLQLHDQALACEPGDPDDPTEPPSLLIGCPIQSCPDKTQKANPIRYVSADDPPFLILHGTSDCLVPWQQSQIFYDALKKQNLNAQLVLAPFAAHGDPVFLLPMYQNRVNEFLDRTLRPEHPRKRAIRR